MRFSCLGCFAWKRKSNVKAGASMQALQRWQSSWVLVGLLTRDPAVRQVTVQLHGIKGLGCTTVMPI